MIQIDWDPNRARAPFSSTGTDSVGPWHLWAGFLMGKWTALGGLGQPPSVGNSIVNLPSLLILARETRPKVAFALALGVWLLAVLAGLSVSAPV